MSSNNNQSATKKHNFCATELKTTTSTAPNGQILKWQLKMYPKGNEEFKDCVVIFLYLIDSKNEEVKAKYQVFMRKSDTDEDLKFSSNKYLKFDNSKNKNWGTRPLIKMEDLLNVKNGYLNGDRLTIVWKLTVQQESIVEVPDSRVLEDFSNLFEKSLFPDCKIISEDDKEFKVHKCILGCRSPVFGAMFEHDMLEKNNNEINIEDMKGVVIEQMLRFIYSGKEPNLEDEEMAEDLLIGADKYELPRLKLLCERKLINSLETTNACRLLVLANRYSAKHLKAQAINFIKIHGNEVMESEDWKELADDPLKDQILKAFMAKQI